MSNVEATAGDWESKPITDRECIYRCLENCQNLAGLDKKQVMRLMEEFTVEKL